MSDWLEIIRGGTLYPDGTALYLGDTDDGLACLSVEPMQFSEIHYLFTEQIDCASVVVSAYGRPAFFCGEVKDKFVQELADERGWLEVTVVERAVDENEWREIRAGWPNHPLVAPGFSFSIREGRRAVIRAPRETLEAVLPYFFRRAFFETAEKNLRSDGIFRRDVLPAVRRGMRFRHPRRDASREEFPAVTALVCGALLGPSLPIEQYAALPPFLPCIQFHADAAGNLKQAEAAPLERRRLRDDEWLYPGIQPWIWRLVLAASLLVWPLGGLLAGPLRFVLWGLGLAGLVGLFMAGLSWRRLRQREQDVHVHVDSNQVMEDGLTRLGLKVENRGAVGLGAIHLHLRLRDSAGLTAVGYAFLPWLDPGEPCFQTLEAWQTLPPDAALDWLIRVADPS